MISAKKLIMFTFPVLFYYLTKLLTSEAIAFENELNSTSSLYTIFFNYSSSEFILISYLGSKNSM